jgi:hypothetical protein
MAIASPCLLKLRELTFPVFIVTRRIRASSLELERPPFMNVADITDAFEALSAHPCDLAEAPFLLAAATGVPASSVSRLRSGNLNRSKLAGGVLLNSKFHYAPADPGETLAALDRICATPKTSARKTCIAISCLGDQVTTQIQTQWARLGCTLKSFARDIDPEAHGPQSLQIVLLNNQGALRQFGRGAL